MEGSDSEVCTVDWKRLHLDPTALKRYVSCLYGQSMTTKLDYDDEKVVCETSDFSVQIHTLSVLKDDYDPADTSIDHIQAFIGSYSSCIEYPFLCPTDERKLDFNSPRGRLMVEFILYGDDGLNMKHWIDAHDRTCSEEDAGALGEVLSKKLAEEAEGKRAGREQPELTDKSERCRYHLHKEKGLPCYLDKQ